MKIILILLVIYLLSVRVWQIYTPRKIGEEPNE